MATKQKEKKPLHLAKMNIKKGDTVLIITGKDKGKRGTVSRAMPQIDKAMPIHVSNTMLICTECGEPTRVGHDRRPMGADQKLRPVRVCKKCQKVIEDRTRSS